MERLQRRLYERRRQCLANVGSARSHEPRRSQTRRYKRSVAHVLFQFVPSYVSFESALSWHGLIPERVEAILCATLKRPVEFETPVGRYQYRHVPARVFSIGVERVDDATLPWLIASPTKALCDTIARVSSIRSHRDLLAWMDDMRLSLSRTPPPQLNLAPPWPNFRARLNQPKEDIEPFLKDPRELALWSEDFFMGLIPMIPMGEGQMKG